MTDSVADVLTDTAQLLLAEGTYEVVAGYAGTELEKAGSVGQPIEVQYGQNVEHTIDLQLGHLNIEVRDASGQLLDAQVLSAIASPAGQQSEPFSQADSTNPLDLPVLADVPYDIEIETTDGRKLLVSSQRVKEGGILKLEVHVQDLK